mgnify:CR=1 FL=1
MRLTADVIDGLLGDLAGARARARTNGRPFVTLSYAQSVDGSIALEAGHPCKLSGPEALQLTKRMLNETVGEHLTTLLAAGAAVSATARTTEAAQEGLNAFLEKREPKWL